MKSINGKVRIKNKSFWIAMVAMALLLIQQVAIIFGYELDFGDLGNQLKDLINTIFAILALLGVVNDPTTKGLSDSNQALTYEVPKED